MSIEMLTAFFMWCTIINMGLMLFSFAMICLGREWAFAVHHKLFKITREQFDAGIFFFLGAWKIIVFVFFVIPWIALLIVG